MDATIQKILEIVTDTQERVERLELRANDGFRQIDERLGRLEEDVRDIRMRLDALEERVRGQSGYAKEIDAMMTRLAIIEKRVGIN